MKMGNQNYFLVGKEHTTDCKVVGLNAARLIQFYHVLK